MSNLEKIRDLELTAISNPKNVNLILEIFKYLESSLLPEKIAAIHSLRRIFIEILESKRLIFKSSGTEKDSKLIQYRKWIIKNLLSFQKSLNDILHNEDLKLQTVALRTLIEFVKREYLYKDIDTISDKNEIEQKKEFGLRTYEHLIKALLKSEQIDVDLLLMIRSEVFSKYDCSYYALHILHNELKNIKSQYKMNMNSNIPLNILTNGIDLLRVLNVPQPIDEENIDSLRSSLSTFGDLNSNFLVVVTNQSVPTLKSQYLQGGEGDQQEGEDDDDSDDDEMEATQAINEDNGSTNYHSRGNSQEQEKRRKKAAEDAALLHSLSNTGKKRKAAPVTPDTEKRKKADSREMSSNRQPLSHKLFSIKQHKKTFTKAWLTMLSMPNLSIGQHKTILKHLPKHLMQDFDRPIMLADYLTQSFAYGGVVAILALESLFSLIIHYNLDYPRFFESLYKLCTADVLSAKHRSKFMELLSASLQSTNLPVYMVAAFIKRLARLSLCIPAPSALYCIAQITWLLREHPECIVLLHREDNSQHNLIEFDSTLDDMQHAEALSSSLWEVEALRHHYSCLVSDMSASLENPASTTKPTSLKEMKRVANNAVNPINTSGPIIMTDFVKQSYTDMIQNELKKANKKRSAVTFNHQMPVGVFGHSESVVGRLFGI